MSDELFAELFGESGSESGAHTTKSNTAKKKRMSDFPHPGLSKSHAT